VLVVKAKSQLSYVGMLVIRMPLSLIPLSLEVLERIILQRQQRLSKTTISIKDNNKLKFKTKVAQQSHLGYHKAFHPVPNDSGTADMVDILETIS
jgi:hypothetical protein